MNTILTDWVIKGFVGFHGLIVKYFNKTIESNNIELVKFTDYILADLVKVNDNPPYSYFLYNQHHILSCHSIIFITYHRINGILATTYHIIIYS